ncbi:MAG: arginine decarboxylase [Firmicutes bacterium]|nr:arginine decarboxylase [Bacillota bacterium]
MGSGAGEGGEGLSQALRRLSRQIGWRWHTPGHKGRPPAGPDFLDWTLDLTEVGDLASDEGPWEQSQQQAARYFGVERVWFSVQGATLPVMAALLGAFRPGAKVAIERHAHRSVLAALVIGDLNPIWIVPELGPGGAPWPISADWQALATDADGLVLTRPTYEGIALPDDVLAQAIACFHRQGKVVVVDEAHGAHWWHRAGYPASALTLGADLVAHGIHKTESALTQTGVLYAQGSRVDWTRLEGWWRRLQTSSPSYLLLASIDRWWRHREAETRGWEALPWRAEQAWEELVANGHQVLQREARRLGLSADPGKLTVVGTGMDWGRALYPAHAAEKMEPGHLTFILSPWLPLRPLLAALKPLAAQTRGTPVTWPKSWPLAPQMLSPRQAVEAPSRWLAIRGAVGAVAAEAVTPYPPGIPLIYPGEAITAEAVAWIEEFLGQRQGIVHGLRAGQVAVVAEG